MSRVRLEVDDEALPWLWTMIRDKQRERRRNGRGDLPACLVNASAEIERASRRRHVQELSNERTRRWRQRRRDQDTGRVALPVLAG